MARLSYARLGEKACFAGMLFREAPPDYRAGTSMLEYFFEEVTPALGLEPGATSVIRKPIIALLLAKYGLEPEFNDDRHRRYYDIVPNRGLAYMYPLASPSRRVDMHTSYTP